MSPQNPKDNELSLKPSSSGTSSSPDFSDVQGHADTVPAAGRSPEFADVQGHTDTVPAGAGQTYTVQKGDTLYGRYWVDRPPLLIAFLLQRYLIQGMLSGAAKG